jgi:hypothetical protein
VKLTPPSSREPAVDPRTGTFSRTWINYFQQLFDRVGGVGAELLGLADFKGRNQQLDTPGFQKFPGGLIRQWGEASTSDAGTVVIVFPAPFARQCVTLKCEETGVDQASGITFAHGEIDLDQVIVYSSGAGTTNAAKRFTWEAIGY